MGSKTFDGVWFISYAQDHWPPHVHGEYGETVVIVDLLPDNRINRSRRSGAVKPTNAKQSEVRRILKVAAEHSEELWKIWEVMHGTSAQ